MASVTFSSSFKKLLLRISDESRVANYLALHSDNTHADYVTRRGDMLSYLPTWKPHLTSESGEWRREGRQEAKPAKLARKLIAVPEGITPLTDKDFEIFATLIKSQSAADLGVAERFSLASGYDIKTWYSEFRHAGDDEVGTLATSCMRHEYCETYFDIYTQNPEVVQLLILTNAEDKLIGRALVWTTENGVFMDRVYGTETTVSLFHDYAAGRGWYHRRYNTHEHPTSWVDSNGDACERTITIGGLYADFAEYPYMDTFKYVSIEGSAVSNHFPDCGKWFIADGVDGSNHTGFRRDMLRCSGCGENTYEELTDGLCASCFDCVYAYCLVCGQPMPVGSEDIHRSLDGDPYCPRCYQERYTRCSTCDGEMVLSWYSYFERDGENICRQCREAAAAPLPNESSQLPLGYSVSLHCSFTND